MPRTDLKRRLQVLEALRPTAEDEDQQRQDAIWQAILTHPDAADLLRLMDRMSVLVHEHGEDCPEVFNLLQQMADIMNGTEAEQAPRRTR